MEKSLIISNTTPLINFAEIGRLDLLDGLFGQLTIPPEVAQELTAKKNLFPMAARVPLLASVSIMAPADPLLVKSFSSRVHPGEAECLALGMEHTGSFLLLDDLAARELATANCILFTGTLGCLIEAKRQKMVPLIEPLLRDLRTKARFWISELLKERILRDVGEL